MRNSVVNKICEYARRDKSIFLISGDAGYGILDEYRKLFSDRYLNLGVAEQNMISFAAGLGLVGYNVFVYNIVPFVMYRCYEQVRDDICYQQLPVTMIGVGSGVTYAPGGMTHYSVEDIALARTLPNLVILSPSDPLEAQCSVDFAVTSEKPVYIRISKTGEPIIHKNAVKDITKPQIIQEGSEVAVLFHGSISKEIIDAVETTSHLPLVISIPMVQPLDFGSLSNILTEVHALIVVEEHFAQGGMGSIIAEWIEQERHSFKLIKLGIRNEYLYEIRNVSGMRDFYGISACHIKDRIEKAYENV